MAVDVWHLAEPDPGYDPDLPECDYHDWRHVDLFDCGTVEAECGTCGTVALFPPARHHPNY